MSQTPPVGMWQLFNLLVLNAAPKKKKLHKHRHISWSVRKTLFQNTDVTPSIPPITTSWGRKETYIINMPLNTDEAALLCVPPSEFQDGFELKNFRNACRFKYQSKENQYRKVRVSTGGGTDLLVAVQGDIAKPAIVTYHDLGVNFMSFQSFFNYVDMRALLCHFCVYHVNAPGQEADAPNLPEDYVYPTMDELATQLLFVLAHFGLNSVIGFGVGFGANVLTRLALGHPQRVDALVVVNCSSGQTSWMEWGWQKIASRNLRNNGMTQHVLDNILWHHFGRNPEERVPDLTATYRSYLTRVVNPFNLSLLMESYTRRLDLGITRENGTLKVPVLNITGALSPYLEPTVEFNARLNPQFSTWMKISDCSSVLEEQPAKVSEAFRLFLQGEGYAVLALQKIGGPGSNHRHSD